MKDKYTVKHDEYLNNPILTIHDNEKEKKVIGFGLTKAKAIMANIEVIAQFVEAGGKIGSGTPPNPETKPYGNDSLFT